MRISRREFTFGLTYAIGTLRLNSLASPPQNSTSDAGALYDRSIVIDALAGPANGLSSLPLTQSELDIVSNSGITAINVTADDDRSDFEETVAKLALLSSLPDVHPNHFLLIRRHADLHQAKKDKKLGLMLGFQSTSAVSGNLDRLLIFQRLGVRIMQLTYNNRNLFGDGCLEPGNAGLSKLGRAAVKQMNSLGIAIDLSHCGTQTTFDGIESSAKPVLITHSGCNAIYRHPRNKDDRELKQLAQRGGVIGIYLMPFLGGGPEAASQELLIRHIEHALKICGTDHVGIGSDLSLTPVDDTPEYRKRREINQAERRRLGIAAPDESRPLYVTGLNHPRRLEGIAVALASRGHSSDVIEKVLGNNFARVLKEIW